MNRPAEHSPAADLVSALRNLLMPRRPRRSTWIPL